MDPLVERIVDRIVSDLEPTRVILFGSRARGGATVESDVDLLVVYDGPLSKRDAKLRIRRLFPLPDFSLDLFVLTSDEFSRQQRVVSTLGRIAAEEGVVCYG